MDFGLIVGFGEMDRRENEKKAKSKTPEKTRSIKNAVVTGSLGKMGTKPLCFQR